MKHKGFAPFVLVIAIAVGLGIAAIVGISTNKSYKNMQPATNPSQPPQIEDEATQKLRVQSSSDEIDSIQADLQMTDLSSLDQEISDIEAQLDLDF